MALKAYTNMTFIGNDRVTGNSLYKDNRTNEVFQEVSQLIKVTNIDEHIKSLLEGSNNGDQMIKS
jgi:hypothetical protein